MNEQERMVAGAGRHIWLHYATTVTVGARTHTFEMGIPVPLGADDELREQLLREANAGMNQLIGSVENRVAQMLQRVPPTQGTIPTPTPGAKPSVTPPPRPRPTTPSNSPTSATSSMSDVSASSTTPPVIPPIIPPATQQPASPYNASQTASSSQGREVRESRDVREAREAEKEQEREITPSTSGTGSTNGQHGQATQSLRQNIGMSLPSTGEITKNFSLPQFIQYINEHLGLNPKQAMEVLKVKSLSGINLRDALEQLLLAQSGASTPAATSDAEGSERGVEKERTGATDPSMKAITGTNGQRAERAERIERVERAEERLAKPETRNASPSASKQPIPFRPATGKAEESRAHTRTQRESPAYFDEEDDERDGDIEDELLDDGDDGDEDQSQGLSPQERVQANALVSRLRESQGVAIVNPARLKVLSNVIGDQLDEIQLTDMVVGVWGIPTPKRLKVDQAEALISWAKEDDFQNEAEIVLMFLEEDAFARGNR